MNIQNFFSNYEKCFWQDSQEDTEIFLRESIAQAEAENDENSLVTILNEAAGYFRNISKYAEAIKAANRALDILDKLGYRGSVPYGTTQLNAATAYRASGDMDTAMTLFSESLATLEVLLPATDYRLAALHNNISAIHEERGCLEKALEALEQAAKILEANADLPDDAAIVLTNQAMLLQRMSQDDKALAKLEDATALFRKGAEKRGDPAALAPQYAAATAGLGGILFGQGQYNKAARCYEMALNHIRATFGQNQDYVTTCHNCADAFFAAGNTEKGRAMRELAENAQMALGMEK